MKHRLPRARAHVQHCTVSLLNFPLARNLGRRQVTAANYFGILRLGFLQSSKMLFWDDEYVRRRLRADVLKSNHVRVLVNLRCGNLAAENAAKQAAATGVSHG